MTASTFDTHAVFKQLTASGFNEAQAEAIVQAQQKALEQSELATKADIAALRTDIATVKADLIKWVVSIGVVQTGLIGSLILALVKT